MRALYSVCVLFTAALISVAGCSSVSPDPLVEVPNEEGVDGGTTFQCSDDGQNVIDQNGELVETCAVGLGCAFGECVAGCEAAAAAGGSVGCDFLAAVPHFYASSGSCFAVFLANNGTIPADVSIGFHGTELSPSSFGLIPNAGDVASWAPLAGNQIPGGEVAVFFLTEGQSNYTCPIGATPALGNLEASAVAGAGSAISIQTTQPVSAYSMNPFGGARSYLPAADLLLPTTAWGTNYIAVVPPASTNGGLSADRWGQVIAMADDTQITIQPPVDLPAAGAAPIAPAGSNTTFSLGTGEFVEWKSPSSLTGMIIQSDKPISFVGGDTYICYSTATSTGGGCDSSYQALPPVQALGDHYAIAPHPPRNGDSESIRYQLVGMVGGTTLSFQPPIAGAPTALAAGQEVTFEATTAFTVQSQDSDHPFAISQTMSGCFVNGGACIGDEEVTQMLPPAQFLRQYVFLTDSSYDQTRLSLVRVRGDSGFADVKLECLGAINDWRPVGDGSQYEYAYVTLKGLGAEGVCPDGRHVASSTEPFGLTAWGLSNAASYGYPAGGGFAAINDVVVPPVE